MYTPHHFAHPLHSPSRSPNLMHTLHYFARPLSIVALNPHRVSTTANFVYLAWLSYWKIVVAWDHVRLQDLRVHGATSWVHIQLIRQPNLIRCVEDSRIIYTDKCINYDHSKCNKAEMFRDLYIFFNIFSWCILYPLFDFSVFFNIVCTYEYCDIFWWWLIRNKLHTSIGKMIELTSFFIFTVFQVFSP
jgi:hypothetical protein